jgi:hypothetical protein
MTWARCGSQVEGAARVHGRRAGGRAGLALGDFQWIHASITGQSTELVCFRLDEALALDKVEELGADRAAGEFYRVEPDPTGAAAGEGVLDQFNLYRVGQRFKVVSVCSEQIFGS